MARCSRQVLQREIPLEGVSRLVPVSRWRTSSGKARARRPANGAIASTACAAAPRHGPEHAFTTAGSAKRSNGLGRERMNLRTGSGSSLSNRIAGKHERRVIRAHHGGRIEMHRDQTECRVSRGRSLRRRKSSEPASDRVFHVSGMTRSMAATQGATARPRVGERHSFASCAAATDPNPQASAEARRCPAGRTPIPATHARFARRAGEAIIVTRCPRSNSLPTQPDERKNAAGRAEGKKEDVAH